MDQREDVLRLHRRDGRYNNVKAKIELTYTDDLEWITVNTRTSAIFKNKITAYKIRVSASTLACVKLHV